MKKVFNCKYCNKENKWKHQTTNQFCNNTCSSLYQWENVTKPRIERGECTHNSGVALKRYLVEKRGEVCSECNQTPEWNGKPLTLQLDHIDGDSDNNFPENLRLLCPNCHSQSDNFGSKGKGSRYKKVTKRNTYLQDYKAGLV